MEDSYSELRRELVEGQEAPRPAVTRRAARRRGAYTHLSMEPSDSTDHERPQRANARHRSERSQSRKKTQAPRLYHRHERDELTGLISHQTMREKIKKSTEILEQQPEWEGYTERVEFQQVVALLIIVNTFVITLEALYIHEPAFWWKLQGVEMFFSVLFVIEIAWRLIELVWVWGVWAGMEIFLSDWLWNTLDVFLAIVSFMESLMTFRTGAMNHGASLGRVMRIFRVMRFLRPCARSVRFFDDADYVVTTASKAMIKLSFVVALIIFISAVMAVNLLADCHDPEVTHLFGDLSSATWTMFKLMTGDNWIEITKPVIAVRSDMLVFFGAFIFVSSIGLLTLIPTVFIELNLIRSNVEREMQIAGDKESAEEEQLRCLEQQEKFMRQLFKQVLACVRGTESERSGAAPVEMFDDFLLPTDLAEALEDKEVLSKFRLQVTDAGEEITVRDIEDLRLLVFELCEEFELCAPRGLERTRIRDSISGRIREDDLADWVYRTRGGNMQDNAWRAAVYGRMQFKMIRKELQKELQAAVEELREEILAQPVGPAMGGRDSDSRQSSGKSSESSRGESFLLPSSKRKGGALRGGMSRQTRSSLLPDLGCGTEELVEELPVETELSQDLPEDQDPRPQQSPEQEAPKPLLHHSLSNYGPPLDSKSSMGYQSEESREEELLSEDRAEPVRSLEGCASRCLDLEVGEGGATSSDGRQGATGSDGRSLDLEVGEGGATSSDGRRLDLVEGGATGSASRSLGEGGATGSNGRLLDLVEVEEGGATGSDGRRLDLVEVEEGGATGSDGRHLDLGEVGAPHSEEEAAGSTLEVGAPHGQEEGGGSLLCSQEVEVRELLNSVESSPGSHGQEGGHREEGGSQEGQPLHLVDSSHPPHGHQGPLLDLELLDKVQEPQESVSGQEPEVQEVPCVSSQEPGMVQEVRCEPQESVSGQEPQEVPCVSGQEPGKVQEVLCEPQEFVSGQEVQEVPGEPQESVSGQERSLALLEEAQDLLNRQEEQPGNAAESEKDWDGASSCSGSQQLAFARARSVRPEGPGQSQAASEELRRQQEPGIFDLHQRLGRLETRLWSGSARSPRPAGSSESVQALSQRSNIELGRVTGAAPAVPKAQSRAAGNVEPAEAKLSSDLLRVDASGQAALQKELADVLLA